MTKFHTVKNATMTGTILHIQINGKEYQIDLTKHSHLLKTASQKQINNFTISPSGYGIHWPDLDEDLSIDGLLGITHAPSKMKAISACQTGIDKF